MGPGKGLLQLLQLERGEGGPIATLLPAGLELLQLTLGQFPAAFESRAMVVVVQKTGLSSGLFVEVVDVDLFVVFGVVVVVESVADFGLARVLSSRVRMAALRSGLVLEVEQLEINIQQIIDLSILLNPCILRLLHLQV